MRTDVFLVSTEVMIALLEFEIRSYLQFRIYQDAHGGAVLSATAVDAGGTTTRAEEARRCTPRSGGRTCQPRPRPPPLTARRASTTPSHRDSATAAAAARASTGHALDPSQATAACRAGE